MGNLNNDVWDEIVGKGNAMLKILVMHTCSNLARGGIETFWLSVLEHMDLSEYDITYFVPGFVKENRVSEKMQAMGISIEELGLELPDSSEQPLLIKVRNNLRIAIGLVRLCKTEHYDIIHINTGAKLYPAMMLTVARMSGIPRRIMHSHNAIPNKAIFSACLQKIICWNATDMLACSKAAAVSMFGGEAVRRTTIIKNGIDVKRFSFCQESRQGYRRKLGLGDSVYVIGNVGRLVEQKNQGFLIKVFASVIKKDPSCRLMIVGDGPLEQELKELAGLYQIMDQIIFVGTTEHVAEYMSAMDVFVLPSFFEGLGIVNIEAQASGLPCIVSDAVPEEAMITDLIECLPLHAGEEVWADKILSCRSKARDIKRIDALKSVYAAGYDAAEVAKKICGLYMEE